MRSQLLKAVSVVLISSLVILSGCSASESTKADISVTTEQNDNLTQENHVMRATITEIGNSSMTVTPVKGSDELKSSDKFTIAISDMDASREPVAGDTVEITYNGDILETYPAQLGEVFKITLNDDDDTSQQADIRRMVMADGVLYLDTGLVSDATRKCGTLDGTIEEVIDSMKIPSADGQANFEADGWQVGSEEDTIEVPIGDEWHIFAVASSNGS